jgi:RHS repeat-associated protein
LHALGCDWLEFGADLRVGLSRAYNGAYGYEYIPFTGLYHVGAREYDPRTARWLQRDPIDVAGDTQMCTCIVATIHSIRSIP